MDAIPGPRLGGGAVDAMPGPRAGAVDAMPGPPRGTGEGLGRTAVAAGEEVAAGAVVAGESAAVFFSAAWRIWSLRPVSEARSGHLPSDPEKVTVGKVLHSLEKVQASAADHPLHTVLVAHPERLPHLLLVLVLACDGDSGATALFWRVLGDFSELARSARAPRDGQWALSSWRAQTRATYATANTPAPHDPLLLPCHHDTGLGMARPSASQARPSAIPLRLPPGPKQNHSPLCVSEGSGVPHT